MKKLLTFEEVIKQTNKPHLLLGNGFSMAYDPERFSFTSLLQSAIDLKIIDKKDFIYRVFETLKTADFESVMKMLDDSRQVIKIYDDKAGLDAKIEKDSTQLKKHLVSIITNNHPAICTEIADANKQSCVEFLRPFKNIYTLNYDLLLYWAIMHDNSSGYTDGFGEDNESIDGEYVVFKNTHGSRLFYLHGGLHIFDAGDEIIKKTYSKTGIKLFDQIKENLDKNIYPVFISEGDSKQKKTKILHNSYLNHCYKSLRFIGGDLVILGTELKRNDTHILDAIMESKVENIFIGVSKAGSVDHIVDRVDEFNKELSSRKISGKKKRVFLYNYKTANIWKNI